MELDESILLHDEPNPRSRLEYSILDKQKELNLINLSYNRSVYYPNLRGLISYGYNTGTNSFSEFWKFGQNWFNYGFYGITLRIPIMNGFKRKYTVQRIQAEGEKIELDKAQFVRSMNFEVAQAENNLRENLYELNNQERNLDLAREVVRRTQIKYENGVGANLEVIEAETDYKQAETNYYAALYQALVSKVDLERALGKLVYD
ncbi:MAG: TolC family protein [Bacteroidia bacterium]|nr:TolC family protein [Bacteroidia bacterium]